MKRISRTSAARPEWTLRAMSGQQRPRHSAGRRSRSDSGARPAPGGDHDAADLDVELQRYRLPLTTRHSGEPLRRPISRLRDSGLPPTALQPHRCPQVRGDIDGLAVLGVEFVDAARAIADDLEHDAGHSKINPQPRHSAGHCQRRRSLSRPGHDHYREGDRLEWALQCRA